MQVAQSSSTIMQEHLEEKRKRKLTNDYWKIHSRQKRILVNGNGAHFSSVKLA